jgi:hypothetical protein
MSDARHRPFAKPPLSRRLDHAAILGADYWRSDLASLAPGGKEWTHFSVAAPGFDLIANFSLTRREGGKATPRLALLLRDVRGQWEGEARAFASGETEIVEGSPDVRMGENGVRFLAGRYRLKLNLPKQSVAADLELEPAAFPLVAGQTPLSISDTFAWAVVPRLAATGEARAFGQRHRLEKAPAYHDRNWGVFPWGGGCAWEWAAILSPDPDDLWSLVFSRLTDRLRGRTMSQSLLVWRGERLVRKFYGSDLKVAPRGVLTLARPLRVPRVSALALPGQAADAPRGLDVAAEAYGDRVEVGVTFPDFAQIVFPNDRFPGLTALSESPGRARVRGRISARAFDFEARAHAEFNHAA